LYYNAINPADTANFGINSMYAAPDPQNAGSYLTPQPVAVLPNIAAYDATFGALSNMNPIDLGGLDEPWDAPDLQNMFLAMVPPRAAEYYLDTDTANNLPILPSFHRPELVFYWLTNTSSGYDLPANCAADDTRWTTAQSRYTGFLGF
jgi:hypothetical protein